MRPWLTLILIFLASFVGCRSDSVEPASQEAPELQIPQIIIATIDGMVAELPPEGRDAILAMESEWDMSGYHHGWGTGIRNSMGLWGDSELALAFKEIGIWHADDMSSILMHSIWRRVHKHDIDFPGQVLFYERYWAENRELENQECPSCGEPLHLRRTFPLVYVEHPKLDPKTYDGAEFPSVEKILQWYRCENSHEYVRTSSDGLFKPDQRHMNALERVRAAWDE